MEAGLCFLPGTISALRSAALAQPPSRTMESGREGGVQAVWKILAMLWLCLINMMIVIKINNIFVYFDKYWIHNQKQIQSDDETNRLFYYHWEVPHCVEVSPAGVACNPRDARVKGVTITISPTDDQPPPRQEGEGVAIPWLRQNRDGAGVRGRWREQLHTW